MTEEQQLVFDELDDILHDGRLSSCIGWAIQQHALISDKQEVRQISVFIPRKESGKLGNAD